MANIHVDGMLTMDELISLLKEHNLSTNRGSIAYYRKKEMFVQPVIRFVMKVKKNNTTIILWREDEIRAWLKIVNKILSNEDWHDVYALSANMLKAVTLRLGHNFPSVPLMNVKFVDLESAVKKQLEKPNIVIDTTEVDTDNSGTENKPNTPSPVNEMRVVHTQFTNGEVKYLSKLHEEVDNILDYVQNFIFIDVPDINTELTNGDDVLKFYKDVFVMANTTQFILKSLKKAANEINELNSNIHIIIDNFLKRIAEK